MLFLIYFLTLTASIDVPSQSPCKLLNDPIEILKCEVEDTLKTNHKVKVSLEVTKTDTKESPGSPSGCAHNECGPCACYTEYEISKNYCNCEHLEPMRDCLAFLNEGYNTSGLYLININNDKTVEVFCDQETDGGGWIVFQRRLDGRTNFYRDWLSYKNGFGNLLREFWWGNENIYLLTHYAEQPSGSELRIDMEDWSRNKLFAKYNKFSIDNEDQKYELFISGFTGNVGDSLMRQNGMMFSTYDADNDKWHEVCARKFRGAWWYKDCQDSNLNGEYRWFGETVPAMRGIIWRHYKDDKYSLKSTEMKVRRKD